MTPDELREEQRDLERRIEGLQKRRLASIALEMALRTDRPTEEVARRQTEYHAAWLAVPHPFELTAEEKLAAKNLDADTMRPWFFAGTRRENVRLVLRALRRALAGV